ncbi:MAG: glycosyltransferase [Halalkalicoccus sp.]|nr:glycosyltransferase [Halalkalicoccus sp.]
MKVLASPVVSNLSDRRYARSYNLLKNIASDDLEIEAYVDSIDSGTRLPRHSVNVHTFHTGSNLKYYMTAFETARRRLKDGDFDVYHHMNLGYRQWNPLLLTDRQKTPTILGPVEAGHDIPAEEFKTIIARSLNVDLPEWAMKAVYPFSRSTLEEVLNPLRESLFARTVRNADRIVAVHSDAKETYAQYADPAKIDVIPYGVDTDRFPYVERTDSDQFVVVGNLIQRKGHRYLLQAVRRVTTERPSVHLHVVSQGPLEAELKQMAKELDIEEAVTFHGFVTNDKLLDLLHDARAFVHPSLSEGFPHVRLEAMAAGCPIIGTAVDGAKDVTRDGVDGLIVPTESSRAIADAMFELLMDEGLAHRMGRSAREKVEHEHDYTDIGRRYLETYRELSHL